MDFWKDGISIEEYKISILVLCLLLCLAFALFMYVTKGDISPNFVSIITALIYAIAGVNAFGAIGSGISNYRQNQHNDYIPPSQIRQPQQPQPTREPPI